MFAPNDLLNEMPKLKKFACKLTRNTAEAEDLTQATLLRALEKNSYFEDGTDLFKWTSKLMYNMFVTEYRRKTKFETQYDPSDAIDSIVSMPEQEDKSEIAAMSRAMDRVSNEHKEVLIMCCVKGMQYKEVSHALDIPVGTVRSRLNRARQSLMAEMDNGPKQNSMGFSDEAYDASRFAA